jgi:hypothetical protein
MGYRDGSNTGVGYNGTYTTDTSTFATPALTDFYLGSLGGTGSFYDGGFSELIIMPYSEENLRNIEGYLTWKYGEESKLPNGHPNETTPPTVGVKKYVFLQDPLGDYVTDESGNNVMVEI